VDMFADLVERLQKIGGDEVHAEEEDTITHEEETDWQASETSSCTAALTRTFVWLIFLCATIFITYAYFNFVFHKRTE
jgi:hypothetical protein